MEKKEGPGKEKPEDQLQTTTVLISIITNNYDDTVTVDCCFTFAILNLLIKTL